MHCPLEGSPQNKGNHRKQMYNWESYSLEEAWVLRMRKSLQTNVSKITKCFPLRIIYFHAVQHIAPLLAVRLYTSRNKLVTKSSLLMEKYLIWWYMYSKTSVVKEHPIGHTNWSLKAVVFGDMFDGIEI